jgi:hypothetical protein
MKMKPLNGTKTHPLSDHAREELKDISRKPVPRNAVNPGVANRLLREGLVEAVMLTSPYKTHNGGKCEHLRIAGPGMVALGLL